MSGFQTRQVILVSQQLSTLPWHILHVSAMALTYSGCAIVSYLCNTPYLRVGSTYTTYTRFGPELSSATTYPRYLRICLNMLRGTNA